MSRWSPEVPFTYLETKPKRTGDDEADRAKYVNHLWYEVYGHGKPDLSELSDGVKQVEVR
jgi:hypothetical protein